MDGHVPREGAAVALLRVSVWTRPAKPLRSVTGAGAAELRDTVRMDEVVVAHCARDTATVELARVVQRREVAISFGSLSRSGEPVLGLACGQSTSGTARRQQCATDDAVDAAAGGCALYERRRHPERRALPRQVCVPPQLTTRPVGESRTTVLNPTSLPSPT